MRRRYASIPPVGESPTSMKAAAEAMRGVLTFITAQEQRQIEPLPSTATNAEIIAKVNELIARLQGTAA